MLSSLKPLSREESSGLCKNQSRSSLEENERFILIDLCRLDVRVDYLKQILILPVLAVLMFVAISHDANAVSTITGNATSCTSTTNCIYAIKTINGNGSATTASGTISFQLPGELKSTSGPYTNSVVSLTGYYLYHMSGSFTITDANTEKIVTGTTNSFIQLVAQHCNQHGCTYVPTLINGTITFNLTNKDGTSTTVTCSPSSVPFSGSSTCTATVKDTSFTTSVPTGTVAFTTSSTLLGTLQPNHCTLTSGSCSVKFHANLEYPGTATISGSYKGDSLHYISSGSTPVTVTGGN